MQKWMKRATKREWFLRARPSTLCDGCATTTAKPDWSLIVVDASALVDLFLELPVTEALLDRVERPDELHAPPT